jgi:hypothetical protein
MVAMLRNIGGVRETPAWVPWVAGAALALYLVGFVDGTVHGQTIAGAAGLPLNYVHEFVHHARHTFFMCH